MDAEVFCKLAVSEGLERDDGTMVREFAGVLMDPPYSYRQITEHYGRMGLKATQLDTSANFYNRAMNPICDAILPGGYAITFGWNSQGFGARRGFTPVEILMVPHYGCHKNDTIVTVEEKIELTGPDPEYDTIVTVERKAVRYLPMFGRGE
jgi:hypothetical protein